LDVAPEVAAIAVRVVAVIAFLTRIEDTVAAGSGHACPLHATRAGSAIRVVRTAVCGGAGDASTGRADETRITGAVAIALAAGTPGRARGCRDAARRMDRRQNGHQDHPPDEPSRMKCVSHDESPPWTPCVRSPPSIFPGRVSCE